jgi:hypothetical protein
MDHHLKGSMWTEKKKVRARIDGLTIRVLLVDGQTTKSTDTECTDGLMAVNLKAIGKTIICMAKASIVGLMAGSMKVNT